MTYKVYCIEHLDTGMKYIGITGDELRIRWRQHYNDPNSAVYKVLRRDGHRMTMTVLEEVTTKDHALRLEQEYIRDMNTAEPHGWNRRVTAIKPKVWNRIARPHSPISYHDDHTLKLLCLECGGEWTHIEDMQSMPNGEYKSDSWKYSCHVITYWCEGCHEDDKPYQEIVIGSHKGHTYIRCYYYAEATS
jgi:predicted GIY-YIG superfamily endonuclease